MLLSFFLIRDQIRVELGLSLSQALDSGMMLGILYDAVLVAVVFGISQVIAALTGLSLGFFVVPLSCLVLFAGLVNLSYFEFFRSPIPLWVIVSQSSDAARVWESFVTLVGTRRVIFASLIWFLSTFLLFRQWDFSLKNLPPLYERAGKASLGAFVIVVALLIRQSPVWFGVVHLDGIQRETALNSQVIQSWWVQSFELNLERKRNERIIDPLERKKESARLGEILLAFKEGRSPRANARPFGLLSRPKMDPSLRRKWIKDLGLAGVEKPNVIFLFMESFRSWEFLDERLGPKIFPNVWKVTKERGVLFKKAYSSSFSAGQTVRGQFSAQCGLLPALDQGAIYINQPEINVSCLPKLLKNEGYQTIWANGFQKLYHNKSLFESLHGVDEFYDQSYFKSKGVREKVGSWGLADRPVLKETAKLLTEKSQSGEPFYVNLLTLSTHHPFRFKNEIELPPEVESLREKRPDYYSYLGLLRYSDEAVGEFLEMAFKEEWGKKTLFVLMGDHSVSIPPIERVSPAQKVDLKFRVPLVMFSYQSKPQVIEKQVHQIDVAPTVASVLGIDQEVAWLGKNVFEEEGSPWVFKDAGKISFRDETLTCLSVIDGDRANCFGTGTLDLISDKIQATKASLSRERWDQVKNFVRAYRKSLNQDLLEP